MIKKKRHPLATHVCLDLVCSFACWGRTPRSGWWSLVKMLTGPPQTGAEEERRVGEDAHLTPLGEEFLMKALSQALSVRLLQAGLKLDPASLLSDGPSASSADGMPAASADGTLLLKQLLQWIMRWPLWGDALAKATKNNSHGLRQGLEALQRVLARTELQPNGINRMIEQSIADTIEPLCFTRRMSELASSSAANEGSGAPAFASPLEPAALVAGPWSYQELVERHRDAWRRFRVAMWRLCDACMPTDGSNGRPSPGPVLQALREAPTMAKLPAHLGGEVLGCVRELLWFHLRRDPTILSEVFAKQACGPACRRTGHSWSSHHLDRLA